MLNKEVTEGQLIETEVISTKNLFLICTTKTRCELPRQVFEAFLKRAENGPCAKTISVFNHRFTWHIPNLGRRTHINISLLHTHSKKKDKNYNRQKKIMFRIFPNTRKTFSAIYEHNRGGLLCWCLSPCTLPVSDVRGHLSSSLL